MTVTALHGHSLDDASIQIRSEGRPGINGEGFAEYLRDDVVVAA